MCAFSRPVGSRCEHFLLATTSYRPAKSIKTDSAICYFIEIATVERLTIPHLPTQLLTGGPGGIRPKRPSTGPQKFRKKLVALVILLKSRSPRYVLYLAGRVKLRPGGQWIFCSEQPPTDAKIQRADFIVGTFICLAA